ncbi:hypothetical protein C5167_016805 [Papaver somniferum]|nr:hypothetical protein C5167_016805 [Papaver somniferum]
MVKSNLRYNMGLPAKISVEIFWDNDRIECEFDFFEMWRYAVEDKDGFVTLHVDMEVSNGVDMAGSTSGGDMAVSIRGNINFLLDTISMENLEDDVLENILFRLPLGTASSQAKRVCRLWKTILSNVITRWVTFSHAMTTKMTQKTVNFSSALEKNMIILIVIGWTITTLMRHSW